MQLETTHVRIYKNSIPLLEELNNSTGGNSPETLDRIIKFAIVEKENYLLRKQYNNYIKHFGGVSLNNGISSSYVNTLK